MFKRTPVFLVLLFAFAALFNTVLAQAPTWTFEPFGKEKKPEKYEERKLGSEKTAEKKFTNFRNVVQNNITHYNYYFNANNKINAVIERAKMANKDDYSKLLTFYPYQLQNTISQKSELDSVIYKATAGILLHDLRNDWIDNMYLLIGKSYYYRGEFDSAAMTFQFINYNLFPRKKHEDDNRVVGGNESGTGGALSIANREKRNILQKVTALPPSRNDALIWLARTLIEQNDFGESAGLINTLQNDPNLPVRLRNDVDEVNAYWYFKQAGYDSAATHLEKAISNADDKQDKSRREFLLAQLYEMGGQVDKASAYYNKASKHTVDPLLDIYAELNDAKLYKAGDNSKQLDRSIAALLKMGRKDKFENYRDIVYFSAAQLLLQKPDTNTAIIYFDKSVKYNQTNITYKNKAFLQLGEIAYKRRLYKLAANMYDSLQMNDSTFTDKLDQVAARRDALKKIVGYITVIETEDSLQRIAALSPADREAFVRKLAKKLRKENGLKDDGSNSGSVSSFVNKNNGPADLFAANNKGEWYFYNSSLRSKGSGEFKGKWGDRPNVDNWRRKAIVDQTAKTNPSARTNMVSTTPGATNAGADISYESLMGGLPLTTEKLDTSNQLIAENLLSLAKLYQNELEDYNEAAKTYEEYLRRFPSKLDEGKIYLSLYYCYSKVGDTERANYYKNLLNTKFANTKSWQMMNTPAALDPKTKNPQATKTYEGIYDLFLEGKFDQALAEKKKADSTTYGINYWSPQLSYIEALYNVKQQNDSLAIDGLNAIIKNNPTSPLKDKAVTMIDVLKRRKEIESYLTNLQVTRAEDDKVFIPDDKPAVKQPPVPVKNVSPAVIQKPTVAAPIIKDTVVKAPPVIKDTVAVVKAAPLLTNGSFTINPAMPHVVLMILEKVDGVYVTEARNAFIRYNKQNYYGQTIDITKDALDGERNLLVISSFADGAAALDYYDKIKRAASREVSWLPANKYSFIIITPENLQVLKTNKDITGYKALLNKQYPGKF